MTPSSILSGAMTSLLGAGSADQKEGHPPVTMVFCCVDGGKQFVAKHRRDAEQLHQQLVAVMRSVLMQVLAVVMFTLLFCKACPSHFSNSDSWGLFCSAAGWVAQVHGGI